MTVGKLGDQSFGFREGEQGYVGNNNMIKACL